MASSRPNSAAAPNPARPKRRRPSFYFSLHGLIYCCIMMFMGLAAINSGANLLYGVFGLMIGTLLVSSVVGRKVLGRLEVRRSLPDHATVGVPATIVYEFANGKRFWPSLSVTISEMDAATGFARPPQAYLLHAAARSSAEARGDAVPARRGIHTFDRFQLGTSFPFGFVRRAVVDAQLDRLLVYPPVGTLDRRLLALCRPAEHSGPAVRPRPGGQDEFFGVKEHRPGDNPRHIHWRRSARTAASGVLIAREMTQVSPPRLIVLVDTHLGGRSAADFAAVEKSVAMAATLVSAALEDDLSVGLVAWGGDGWRRVDASRGKRHRSDLLSALAALPINDSADVGKLLDQGMRYTRDGSTAVLLTPRDVPAGQDRRQRGAVVTMPAGSEQATNWFSWEPAVDFATVVPPDQVAEIGNPARPRRG